MQRYTPPSKGKETRKAIIEEAVRQLKSREFRDVTVTSIMADLPQSKATFYQYFKKVSDIAGMLLDEFTAAWKVHAIAWLEAEDNHQEIARETLTAVVYVAEKYAYSLRLARDAAAYDADMEAHWTAFRRDSAAFATAIIERDQAAGVIRKDLRSGCVAGSLVLMTTEVFIYLFGFPEEPREKPENTALALRQIWMPTLYGLPD